MLRVGAHAHPPLVGHAVALVEGLTRKPPTREPSDTPDSSFNSNVQGMSLQARPESTQIDRKSPLSSAHDQLSADEAIDLGLRRSLVSLHIVIWKQSHPCLAVENPATSEFNAPV